MVMTDEDRTTVFGANEPAPRSFRTVERNDDTAEQEPAEPGGSRRTAYLALGAAAALAVVFALFWVLIGPGSKPDQVAVPDLSNKSLAQAQDALQKLGFTVAIQQKPDSKVADGNVIATQPLGGSRIDEGSTVTVQVSSGPDQVQVPRLDGLTVQQAEQELNSVGLRMDPNVVRKESSAQDLDKVIGTEPSAGARVDVDQAIVVWLGKGPEKVRVPSLVGQDISVAQPNLVDSAGFKIVIEEVQSSKPKGEVIATSPAGGTNADKGSTVTVQVSSGDQISMPSVVGLTPSQAVEKLRQAGWTGSTSQINQNTTGTFDAGSVGRIISQQPSAGSSISKTSTITITTGVLGPP